ncbi:hypothetical protein JW964_27575 [candidate division KSB1 bacterium]|nr:hypothetical protein [candidate division KSB1 bacterium]
MLKDEIKQIKSEPKDLKQFGLVIGIVLLVIGSFGHVTYIYFLICGVIFILAGLIFPVILKPLQKIWMAIALVLGWFMSRLVVTIIFYLILTPVGLIAKLAGKQFLELKGTKSQKSYWNYRQSATITKIDLEKQF